MIPVVSFVGKSNSGKTTLIEKTIRELKKRGYRIATIKHTRHGFDIDHKGKDTWRHREAGSEITVMASPHQVAVIESARKDYPIDELVERYVHDVDIVIVEGFKGNPYPKIEVYRSVLKRELLCGREDNLIAIASDILFDMAVPCYDLNDVDGLVNLIENEFLSVNKK